MGSGIGGTGDGRTEMITDMHVWLKHEEKCKQPKWLCDKCGKRQTELNMLEDCMYKGFYVG